MQNGFTQQSLAGKMAVSLDLLPSYPRLKTAYNLAQLFITYYSYYSMITFNMQFFAWCLGTQS